MPGVGKSVVIQQFLNTAGRCARIWEFLFIAYMPHMQAGELFATASANFSAQTSTANVGVLKDEGQSKTKRKCQFGQAEVVDQFENRLERKRKTLLGAPPGTTMCVPQHSALLDAIAAVTSSFSSVISR